MSELFENHMVGFPTRRLKSFIDRYVPAFPDRFNTYIYSFYENSPMQYIEIFFSHKNWKFQQKIFDIFLMFAQNVDCGYTSEPPRRGGSYQYPQSMIWSKNKKNRYTMYPCIPQFCYIKVGFKGVYISRTCFPDVLFCSNFLETSITTLNHSKGLIHLS